MICSNRISFDFDKIYLPSPIVRGLTFLAETDLSSQPMGRMDIDGDDLFAIFSRSQTAPVADGLWEAHRRYADIQYVIEGDELIGWAPDDGSKDCLSREGEDCFFFPVPPSPCWVHMSPGSYAVFFPSDLHCPLRTWGDPSLVRKVVIKVALSLF